MSGIGDGTERVSGDRLSLHKIGHARSQLPPECLRNATRPSAVAVIETSDVGSVHND